MLGLLDTAIPAAERERIAFHALRTRESGMRRFMSVHVLVPGRWTVQRSHALLEAIERDIREAVPGLTVFSHLESLDDPAPWDDTALGRRRGRAAAPHGRRA